MLKSHKHRIAYFSMEIGLDEKIPTYAGGLGVLAGDFLRSAADLQAPMVGVTLINGRGFFAQKLDAGGEQREEEVPWNPADSMTALEQAAEVSIEGRTVYLKAWLYKITGNTGYEVPVIFLDTDMIPNSDADRSITGYLYGGDSEYRLKQEVVLGIGGLRMLEKLGLHIRKYHMNEGHSSLLAMELVKKEMGAAQRKPLEKIVDDVRGKCIFTTHTPVLSGHDIFPYPLVEKVLAGYVDISLLKQQCCGEHLNMTLLGFNLSGYINGVAKKHAETSKGMFPGYAINSVTNGVHTETWTGDAFKRLYDKYIKDWRKDPFLFRYAIGIPGEEIWAAHAEGKRELLGYVNKKYSEGLDDATLTIGFARRITSYKRPALLFSDIERLKRISKAGGGLQIIFSGKAHPEDEKGKKIIKDILQNKKALSQDIRIAYLENYDMGIAKKMVCGVDLWLNTPLIPREASGTSGMKATLNGVLNLSILDGWWIEGYIKDITGFAVGGMESDEEKDSEDLYGKLEEISRIYYDDRKRWISMMRYALSINASFFNSRRMVQQYITDAYWD